MKKLLTFFAFFVIMCFFGGSYRTVFMMLFILILIMIFMFLRFLNAQNKKHKENENASQVEFNFGKKADQEEKLVEVMESIRKAKEEVMRTAGYGSISMKEMKMSGYEKNKVISVNDNPVEEKKKDDVETIDLSINDWKVETKKSPERSGDFDDEKPEDPKSPFGNENPFGNGSSFGNDSSFGSGSTFGGNGSFGCQDTFNNKDTFESHLKI